MNWGPPCGREVGCRFPDDCACERGIAAQQERARRAVHEEIECADSGCALRDGHTVPHMDDLELAWYDGAGQATQKILPL